MLDLLLLKHKYGSARQPIIAPHSWPKTWNFILEITIKTRYRYVHSSIHSKQNSFVKYSDVLHIASLNHVACSKRSKLLLRLVQLCQGVDRSCLNTFDVRMYKPLWFLALSDKAFDRLRDNLPGPSVRIN